MKHVLLITNLDLFLWFSVAQVINHGRSTHYSAQNQWLGQRPAENAVQQFAALSKNQNLSGMCKNYN